MIEYIKVAEAKDKEPIEVPCEPDGTLLLSTLSSAISGATGLKYQVYSTKRNDEDHADSGSIRMIELIVTEEDGKIQPPEEGWTSSSIYYCCLDGGSGQKRKFIKQEEDAEDAEEAESYEFEHPDEEEISSPVKAPRTVAPETSELLIRNLPYATTEEELHEYLEDYGPLEYVQIPMKNNKSLGYAHVRFIDYEAQLQAMTTKSHRIGGRNCEIRLLGSSRQSARRAPSSTPPAVANTINPNKIFIGNLSPDTGDYELRAYFTRYGTIKEIFLPPTYRGFAFITFDYLNPYAAGSPALFGYHNLAGRRVEVKAAVPRPPGEVSPVRGAGSGRRYSNRRSIAAPEASSSSTPAQPWLPMPPAHYYTPYATTSTSTSISSYLGSQQSSYLTNPNTGLPSFQMSNAYNYQTMPPTGQYTATSAGNSYQGDAGASGSGYPGYPGYLNTTAASLQAYGQVTSSTGGNGNYSFSYSQPSTSYSSTAFGAQYPAGLGGDLGGQQQNQPQPQQNSTVTSYYSPGNGSSNYHYVSTYYKNNQ